MTGQQTNVLPVLSIAQILPFPHKSRVNKFFSAKMQQRIQNQARTQTCLLSKYSLVLFHLKKKWNKDFII